MHKLEVTKLLRRHLAAVFAILILAVTIAAGLVRDNAGYQYSGTMEVTTPIIQHRSFTYYKSLLAVEELLNIYMGGQAAESNVRAVGGSGGYSVTMVNQNNEQNPYYKNPYLNIATTGSNPEVTHTSFNAVIKVLTKELTALQGNQPAAPGKRTALTLVFQSGSLVALHGSRVRSLAGLALLTVIAALLSTTALERWNHRRYRRDAVA